MPLSFAAVKDLLETYQQIQAKLKEEGQDEATQEKEAAAAVARNETGARHSPQTALDTANNHPTNSLKALPLSGLPPASAKTKPAGGSC